MFEKSLSNSFRYMVHRYISASRSRFKNETKVESVDVSKDENEFPTRALDLLENRETNDKQKREVEGSRSTTVGWFRARFSWVNDLLVDLTLELFLVYTYLRTGPLDTI